ncbi:MAG TPA: hypothetical protein VK923_13735 [Euzebyales bacterium]|nr:hypothetical protein [Euzebyales bacterium]
MSIAAACWYFATLAGLTGVRYARPGVVHAAALWLTFNTVLLGVPVTRTLAQRYAGERRAS